jgi:hypothetical protein
VIGGRGWGRGYKKYYKYNKETAIHREKDRERERVNPDR